MTATLDTVAKKKEPAEESAELAAARELVRQAKEQGLSLTDPDGLLTQLTKTAGGSVGRGAHRAPRPSPSSARRRRERP
jgi:hypothetical protein